MRALITGISGFAGSHLAEHILATTDWEVAGTVHRFDEGIRHLTPRVALFRADLTDRSAAESVLQQSRPDLVFHLAAWALTAQSFRDPWGTLANNIGMQVRLLEGIIGLGLDCRLLIVGSGEEYGLVGKGDLPVDEETPLRPMNPYAVSKVAQDMLGLQYHLSHAMDVVRVRPFNHIGPRQRLGFVAPDFARQIALIEAGRQEPAVSVGNLEAQRDFTDVRDVVRAYALLAMRGEAGQVYNVGSGEAHAISELLETLLGLSDAPVAIRPDESRMRPSDVARVISDCDRLRRATGWQPAYSFERSLHDTLDYWRQQVGVEEGV